jgi:hypothetical protein
VEESKHRGFFSYKKPVFWIIAAVIAAAVGAGGGLMTKAEAKTAGPELGTEVKAVSQANKMPAVSNEIVYKNTQYGFAFTLPASWKGYTIVTDKWEGDDSQTGEAVEAGPIILIRHPLWTAQVPRQDIPIMIFTLAQWNSLQRGDFHIGAAPIGPSEISRNASYVFALPARYNYAFLPGYQEVANILAGNPLQPMENGQVYK